MTMTPELKQPLPADRTYEQVLNHYLVEKAIAARLKSSTAEQRRQIAESMYEELFEKVPDHPRLQRRHDDDVNARATAERLHLIENLVKRGDHYLEFGPGDCHVAMQVAAMVDTAYGVDISDQRQAPHQSPPNFHLIVYDGFELESPAHESIDLIFSDQLIEHFHPEDTRRHFALAKQLLKPGGRYMFRTPHAFMGPLDVSMYFADEAEGFHLKEWTYAELSQLLHELGYSSVRCYRFIKGRHLLPLPLGCVLIAERALKRLPRRWSRQATKLLFAAICMLAVK